MLTYADAARYRGALVGPGIWQTHLVDKLQELQAHCRITVRLLSWPLLMTPKSLVQCSFMKGCLFLQEVPVVLRLRKKKSFVKE